MDTTLREWLLLHTFRGHEDPPDSNDADSDEGSEGQDDDADDEGSEDEGDGSGDQDAADKVDDAKELKEALAKTRKQLREERKGRRKAERDAQQAKTTREAGEDAKEADKANEELTKEREKNQKMATRLRNKERDDAILAEARKLGFIDPSDALTDEIRNSVAVDQDDEDPSDIEVDEDTVKVAVKKLADKKKHLLGTPGSSTESGGRFRKGGKKKTGEAEKAAQILQDYPSLR